MGDKPQAEDLIGLVKVMLDAYEEGKVDAVYLVSNDFVNTMVQRPALRQLVPVPDEHESKGYWDYIYEPDSTQKHFRCAFASIY